MSLLRRTTLGLASLLLMLPTAASAQLIISEYIEGTSFNKAIEIYNTGAGPVNLANYQLRLYSNGAASPTASVFLSGSLAAGDVYVVANGAADPAILAVTDLVNNTVINFNGDDAVELFDAVAASPVDVLGQIGFDPGTAWTGGSVSTLDRTLRRKPSVCAGDAVGSDPFDPSVQWDGFLTNAFDGLGVHTANCQIVPTRSSTWGEVKSIYR